MKIQKNNYEVSGDKGLITSIKYKGVELLHDGKIGWKKTFPVIFPVVVVSTGFEVEGKNYDIPRHGFWNALEWETILEGEDLVFLSHHIANDVYPFTVSIQMKASITKDKGVKIEVQISNISKETAYFHFGFHPAFVIDKSSKIIVDSKNKPREINLKGRLTDKSASLKETLVSMPFAQDYDTLVYKNDAQEVILTKKDFNLLISHDAPNVQLWKPKDDMFICIEPWWAWNDLEYDAPKSAKDKKDINTLKRGKTFSAQMNIKVIKKI